MSFWLYVEKVLSFLLLLLVIIMISSNLYFFSTSSLWVDEYFTIKNWSSNGFLFSITDYRTANNHILFNALSSLIPKYDPYNPVEARLVSFIFVLISLFVLFRTWYRNLNITYAIITLGLLLASISLLDLIFQARGYGILFSLTILNCTTLYNHFHNKGKKTLYILVLVNILATYAIPSYLIFSLVLFATLFIISSEKKRIFLKGIYFVTGVGLLYSPVLLELIKATRNYASEWGGDFGEGQAIFNVIKTYSILQEDWQTFPFIMIITIGSVLLFKNDRSNLGFILTLLISTFFTFSFYNFMETPILRVASFLIVPLFIILTLFVHGLVKIYLKDKTNKIISSLFILLLLTFLTRQLISREYIPIENWKEVAETISQKFPKGTKVYCNFRKQQLEVYLDEDYPLSDHFDSASFNKGELIFVQSNFKQRDVPKELQNFDFYIIPQKRGKMQEILFHDDNISPTFKIADSVQLNATCCGWTEAKFEFEKPSKVSTVQYTIDNLNISAADFYFQALLKSNESNDVFYASYGKDVFSKKHFITNVSQMSKAGNPNIQQIDELIIRIKIIEKNDFVNLTIKNIVVN